MFKMRMVAAVATVLVLSAAGCGKPSHRKEKEPEAKKAVPAAQPAPVVTQHPDPPVTLVPPGREDRPLSLYPPSSPPEAPVQPAAAPPRAEPPSVPASPRSAPLVQREERPPAVVSAELQELQSLARQTRLKLDHAIEATRSFADTVLAIESRYGLEERFSSTPALSRAERGRLWLRWRELVNIEDQVGPLTSARRESNQLLIDARSGHVDWPRARAALVGGRFDGLADDVIRELPRRYRQLDRIAERLGIELPDWTVKPVEPPSASRRRSPGKED